MQNFPKIWFGLFFILAFVFFLNDSSRIALKKPCSVHMWRQTDCASYALNYYQNNNSFFQPQVMSRLATDGRSTSEFPIIYFLSSRLYKIFGFHDYFIRIIGFIFFVAGLVYTTLIAGLFIQNKTIRIIPAVFMLGSPYIYYYALNFLPDVPALCLSLAGLYHFLKFTKNQSGIHFLSAVLLFTLAALLKISAGILWGSCIIYYFGLLFFNPVSEKKQFPWSVRILSVIMILFSLMALYSWISYAKNYNSAHNYSGNLLGFYGIWDADSKEISDVWSRFFNSWIWDIFSVPSLLFFVLSFFVVLFNYKKIPRDLFILSLISFAGVHLYSLGWYRAFYHHDYYMINNFCFPLLFVICFCVWLEQNIFNPSYLKPVIFSLIAFALCWSLFHSARVQKNRYTDVQYKYLPDATYEISGYLRGLGINNQETVISTPDPSPNMSLYLMNCTGYSDSYYNNQSIDDFKKLGVNYLIALDTSKIQIPLFKDYCRKNHPVGNYKGILVYRFR